MNLYCHSVNFQACSSAAAKSFVLDKAQQEDFLGQCGNIPAISDALVLNTCNRLEFYFYAKKYFDVVEFVQKFISEVSESTRLLRRPCGTPRPKGVFDNDKDSECWKKNCLQFTGIEAVEHLFRVGSGLESQIIGENEIFSQLKTAYSFAIKCGTVQSIFHHLFHSAFRVAKAVRTETNISCGALSIAGAAVALAAINQEIEKAKVFVVGSGANAELLVKHLLKKKAKDITVVARNQNSAQQLAVNAAAKYLRIESLAENILNADIIFTATSAKEPLIDAEMIENRCRPLVLIDIAMPGNIEKIKNQHIKFFDMESLNEIININNRRRRDEIPKAQAVINRHLSEINEWFVDNSQVAAMVK